MNVTTMKPVRKAGVWLRQAEDENAVFDPETNAVHIMNSTAVAIWVLCDGETTPDEMIAAICDLSGLPTEVVHEDVHRILHQFEAAGILVWEG